jgi:hypothetical protein
MEGSPDLDALTQALSILRAGRIDGAYFTPESGLVTLAIYAGRKYFLGVGIGPHLAGIGWLPRAPGARAPATHPLNAAVRAHLVDGTVSDLWFDPDGTLWITGERKGDLSRIGLSPGRRGRALVTDKSGGVVMRWPHGATPETNRATHAGLAEDLETSGIAMFAQSERLAWDQSCNALARAVHRRVQALERRAAAVRADMARLGDVAHLQKIGRMLLVQGHSVPRGSTRATLQDWEEGGTLEVSLDPARAAKAQAETFFAKARRYQRGEAVMRRRLQETQSTLESLRNLAEAVIQIRGKSEGEDPVATLTALSARARSLGAAVVAENPSEPARRKPPKDERRPYNLFRGTGGRQIWVGRGGKDNDALTARHARPHDLWLHAKNITGAHVIVPMEKGTNCPPDLLVDAATLAAYFSDARAERVVEVSYVERRYVRKPRGSAPGAVVFDREKVIVVRIEDDRLERLLATRDPG